MPNAHTVAKAIERHAETRDAVMVRCEWMPKNSFVLPIDHDSYEWRGLENLIVPQYWPCGLPEVQERLPRTL